MNLFTSFLTIGTFAQSGRSEPNMFEGSIEAENVPHLFTDKQLIVVTQHDVIVQGDIDIIFASECEVIGMRGVTSNVGYKGGY